MTGKNSTNIYPVAKTYKKRTTDKKAPSLCKITTEMILKYTKQIRKIEIDAKVSCKES